MDLLYQVYSDLPGVMAGRRRVPPVSQDLGQAFFQKPSDRRPTPSMQ